MAEDFTPSEQKFINEGRTGEEIARRTKQVLEGRANPSAPAPVAPEWPKIPGTLKPAYVPTGNFALYRPEAKQWPGAFVREPEPAPVLVELQQRTAADLPSQRTINRQGVRWSAVEVETRKRHDTIPVRQLEDLDANHPLVQAEMKKRADREVLKTKMAAAAQMFDAIRSHLEQDDPGSAALIDAFRAAGGEWDDSPVQLKEQDDPRR